jgi:4-alpha-glucanotransferase
MTSSLRALADMAGIMDHYWTVEGVRHDTSDVTRRALLEAMGFAAGTEGEAADTLAQETARRAARVLPDYIVMDSAWDYYIRHLDAPADWRVVLEDGGEVTGRADPSLHLPPLPVGRHVLHVGDHRTWILAAPAALDLPARGWGMTVPLYGLRGPGQGGIGDFDDLTAVARGLAPHGAAFLGMNPIHAGFPADPDIRSPYMPSHRRRLNTAYIHTGAAGAGQGALIDHAAELPAHQAALVPMWRTGAKDPAFATWRAGEGQPLEDFATYMALAERHGATWDAWPAALRDPRSKSVARAAADLIDRIDFHAWTQFEAERQLGDTAGAALEAGLRYGLYLDLAVGTHPFGAETWAEPESFAAGVSLGAPPDAFAEDGQTWLLAPFNPRALISSGFAPLAATLRKQFQFAKALRIDHILGFERAFWVPMEAEAPGTYVRMPKEAMLAVIRIEAWRAGGVVVGEDLGNIPEGLQGDLARSGILGCRLALFDSARPGGVPSGSYSEQALASWGTHDVPPFAGWRSGADIALREDLGLLTAEDAQSARTAREAEVAAFSALAGGTAQGEMHGFLAHASSRLIAVQVEDLLEVEAQPNLPGTVDEYPNWQRRLPVQADAIGGLEALAETARIMGEAGR